jgi:hypothetical protein
MKFVVDQIGKVSKLYGLEYTELGLYYKNTYSSLEYLVDDDNKKLVRLSVSTGIPILLKLLLHRKYQ